MTYPSFSSEVKVEKLDLPDDLAGVADGEGVCGDVFGDDAAGANHAIIAYGDAWTYLHSSANPNIISNPYRSSIFNTSNPLGYI